MKKLRSVLKNAVLIGLICALACGCERTQESASEDKTLTVYATFYPLYACAALIAEDVPDIDLHCLAQPQDGCIRDYTLSDWDYVLLARSADVVIAGGRGLESFDDVLYTLGDDGPVIAYVLYNMELKENPGIQDIDADSESHWLDANPHIYMSIDGMKSIVESICAQLCVVDADHSASYSHNLEKTDERLESLRKEMHEICGDLAEKTVILANETLVCFSDEFDLTVEAIIDRDSGEALYDTELEKCLAKLEGCDCKVILIEQQAPQAFVESLERAGYTVVKLNILSTYSNDSGYDAYFDAQIENAKRLANALSKSQEE